jgi:hypothetical protein
MTDRWDEELDQALGALRADVPEMEPRAFAAGRARLQVAIGSPAAAPAREPDEAVALVLSPDRRRRSPPLRRAAPWLAVAAAVAVVAVGAVAFLPGDAAPPGGPAATAPPKPSPTAPIDSTVTGRPGEPLPVMPAKPLNTAGELAGMAHDVALKPGQVRYVRTTSTQAASTEEPGGSQTIELWIPYDRESEWMIRRTASGEIQGRSDKNFEESRANGGRFDHNGAMWPEDPAVIARLPKDPEALYAWLRNKVNADLPSGTTSTMTAVQQAVHEVTSLLNDMTGIVPADLRAALLSVLGYLPGITVTPDAKAREGRTAVALGSVSDDGSYRNELLLATDTAQVVEMRNVVLKPFQGYQRNQVFTSGLRTEAVVTALGERP